MQMETNILQLMTVKVTDTGHKSVTVALKFQNKISTKVKFQLTQDQNFNEINVSSTTLLITGSYINMKVSQTSPGMPNSLSSSAPYAYVHAS